MPGVTPASAGKPVRINFWQVCEWFDCLKLHLLAASTAVLEQHFHHQPSKNAIGAQEGGTLVSVSGAVFGEPAGCRS